MKKKIFKLEYPKKWEDRFSLDEQKILKKFLNILVKKYGIEKPKFIPGLVKEFHLYWVRKYSEITITLDLLTNDIFFIALIQEDKGERIFEKTFKLTDKHVHKRIVDYLSKIK